MAMSYSYEKLGFTSGQTLKAEHLNHMEEGIANPCWNDLTDKPFYTEPVFYMFWDGNTDGKESCVIGNFTAYKVSDRALTMDDCIGGFISSNGIEVPLEAITREVAPGALMIDKFVISTSVLSFNGVEFPSTGTWFIEPCTIYKENVRKIDAKYIPATTIYVTIDENMNSDISVNDIATYINSGFNVMARYTVNNYYCYVPFSCMSGSWVIFSGYIADNGDMKPIEIKISRYGVTITKGATGGGVYFTYGLFLRRPSDNKYFQIEIDDNGSLKATATNFAPEKLTSQ